MDYMHGQLTGMLSHEVEEQHMRSQPAALDHVDVSGRGGVAQECVRLVGVSPTHSGHVEGFRCNVAASGEAAE